MNLSREHLQGGQITPIAADKVDSWAFGVAVLELATGTYPFDRCDIMEKYTKWDPAYFQKKLGKIEFLQQPGDLNEIVKELLDVNPETRLSITKARKRLRRLEAFAGRDEQKAFFTNLKKKEVLVRREPVSRDQDENYADVYNKKHNTALDASSNSIENGYTKTPASVV